MLASRRLLATPLFALGLLMGCTPAEPPPDQGSQSPGEDETLGTATSAITTDDVMQCAQHWVDLHVPYCGGINGGTDYICGGVCHRPAAPWDDYRSDCSGFVSWCWQIPSDPTTNGYMNDKSGATGWHTINIDDLQPGDAVVCDGHIKLVAQLVSSTKAEIYQESDCGEVANKGTETFSRSGNTMYFQYDSRAYHPIRRNNIEPPVRIDGYIDSATASVKGWAADLDAGDKSISVDLYFGGDAGKGLGVSVKASDPRPDVATALGVTPDKGFDVPTPRYYCDNADHSVYAYGHAVKDGTPVELKSSPKTLTCAPTDVGAGLLRHVTSQTVLKAWGFDVRTELAWMTAEDRAAHDTSSDWPDDVVLGITSDGAVWVVDGGTRRHVIDPTSFAAWGFDPKSEVKWDDTEAAKYVQGLDLPATPFLVQELGNPAVYVLDADPRHLGDAPNGQPPGAGGATASGGAGSGGAGSADDPGSKAGAGCTVSSGDRAPAAPLGIVALGLFGVAMARGARRRTRI